MIVLDARKGSAQTKIKTQKQDQRYAFIPFAASSDTDSSNTNYSFEINPLRLGKIENTNRIQGQLN